MTLVVALACTAAPAYAADPVKKELEFEVTVGPNDDTTCKVTANLFTPAGASKSDPVPAVMGTNGFGGSKSDFDSLGPSYAKRGYAFLAYSGLGFGDSGCKITLDDPDWDGKAGSQLLSFLGGTKAALDGTKIDYVVKDGAGDPRVGMIGGSYGGQIQFAIAGIDRRLDTIVPQITWNDLVLLAGAQQHGLRARRDLPDPRRHQARLAGAVHGARVRRGLPAGRAEPGPEPPRGLSQLQRLRCTGLVTSGSTGYPDQATLDFLRHASVTSYMSKIRIPTFLSQGQSDTLFNLQESVATYQALRKQGTPVKMLWRSSGHSGGGIGGESSSTDLESAYESRMALEWFDYYLRGIGDPPALELLVPARLGAVRAAMPRRPSARRPRYPAGADQTAFLSGSDKLVPDKAGVQPGTASFAAAPGAPARAAPSPMSRAPTRPARSPRTRPSRSARTSSSWASRGST